MCDCHWFLDLHNPHYHIYLLSSSLPPFLPSILSSILSTSLHYMAVSSPSLTLPPFPPSLQTCLVSTHLPSLFPLPLHPPPLLPSSLLSSFTHSLSSPSFLPSLPLSLSLPPVFLLIYYSHLVFSLFKLTVFSYLLFLCHVTNDDDNDDNDDNAYLHLHKKMSFREL